LPSLQPGGVETLENTNCTNFTNKLRIIIFINMENKVCLVNICVISVIFFFSVLLSVNFLFFLQENISFDFYILVTILHYVI